MLHSPAAACAPAAAANAAASSSPATTILHHRAPIYFHARLQGLLWLGRLRVRKKSVLRREVLVPAVIWPLLARVVGHVVGLRIVSVCTARRHRGTS